MYETETVLSGIPERTKSGWKLPAAPVSEVLTNSTVGEPEVICVGRGALPASGFTRDIGSGFNDRTSRELQRTTVDGRSGGWFSSVLGVANDSTAYGRSDGDGLYPGGLCREPRHDLRRKRYFRIGGYEGTCCIGNLDLGNDLTRGVVILRSRRKRNGLS